MSDLRVRLDSKEYGRDGERCPVCLCGSLAGTGDNEYEGQSVLRHVRCLDCGAEWDDVCDLVGYANLVIPEPAPVLKRYAVRLTRVERNYLDYEVEARDEGHARELAEQKATEQEHEGGVVQFENVDAVEA